MPETAARPAPTVAGSAPGIRWSCVIAVLVIGYLLLTAAYLHLGYLRNPAERIKPVDSVYYFSYLRSAFFDGDFDFTNELSQLYPDNRKPLTEKGLPSNPFSVGPAICWAPFFLIAHLMTLLGNALGAHWKADGYSDLYQLFVYAGDSFYAAAGLIVTALICGRYMTRVSALLSCLALLLASQITYYIWPFTAMSHNVSFFWTALFLYLFLKSGPSKPAAIAAAFMILARWQDVLFLLFPTVEFARRLLGRGEPEARTCESYRRRYAVFFALVLLLFTPQSLAWWAIYGKPFLIPQGQGFLDATRLPVLSVLFSLRHGLFAWHPLLIVGILGLPLLWARDRALALTCVSVFILETLLNSSVVDWWAGWSFGNRRFISLLPVFAVGFGILLDRLGRAGVVLGGSLILFFGIWNQLFIFQYFHGLIPRGEALSWQQMVQDKFRLKTLVELKDLHRQAMEALNRRDLFQFKQLASKAFSIAPGDIRSNMTYGLACFLTDDDEEGIRVFQHWHALDHRDILARWGLAEYKARQGDRESARGLFSDCGGEARDKARCRKIASAIDSGAGRIVDKAFFDLFKSRLMELDRE